MKTKLSITLTALLMLICVGATAQSVNGNNGKAAVNNVDGIATAIMNGSYQSASDLNECCRYRSFCKHDTSKH